jgi:hypothetical protein
MSAVAAKASAKWPHVKWTGQSSMHVSQAFTFPELSKYTRADAGLVLKIMDKGDLAGETYGHLTKTFPEFEYLFAADQFRSLFMVDIWRHFNKMGSCYTEGKFQNPTTGNWFHKIAVNPQWVGGFRNWVDDRATGHVDIGFRFRIIESGEEEEGEIRERATKTIEIAHEEMANVVEAIQMEVKEPTMAEVKEALKVYQY